MNGKTSRYFFISIIVVIALFVFIQITTVTVDKIREIKTNKINCSELGGDFKITSYYHLTQICTKNSEVINDYRDFVGGMVDLPKEMITLPPSMFK